MAERILLLWAVALIAGGLFTGYVGSLYRETLDRADVRAYCDRWAKAVDDPDGEGWFQGGSRVGLTTQGEMQARATRLVKEYDERCRLK